jgi:hypothetical protein
VEIGGGWVVLTICSDYSFEAKGVILGSTHGDRKSIQSHI